MPNTIKEKGSAANRQVFTGLAIQAGMPVVRSADHDGIEGAVLHELTEIPLAARALLLNDFGPPQVDDWQRG